MKYVVANISDTGQYYPDVLDTNKSRSLPIVSKDLTVTDTWVLFTRNRSNNIFIQDIENLKNNIESLSEDDFPSTAKNIIFGPPDKKPENSGIPENQSLEHLSSNQNEIEAYFPKPFNDAQYEIIRKLKKQDGIVVQGPPGTGKTHTIANIISHYLAQGKRILVTSKGEGALDVLRDQIPEDVQNLCISLLTQDRQGLKQIEKAVRTIADTIQQIQVDRLNKEINNSEKSIQLLNEEIQKIDKNLERMALEQLTPISEEYGEEYKDKKPSDLAEMLVDNQLVFSWFPDNLDDSQKFEPIFDDSDIQIIKDKRAKLGKDIVFTLSTLPNINDFPDTANILSIHNQLIHEQKLSKKVTEQNIPLISCTPQNAVQRAENLLKYFHSINAFLKNLDSQSWFKPIYHEWLNNGFESERYRAFYLLCSHLQDISSKRMSFLERPIKVTEKYTFTKDIELALIRASKGQKPFSLLDFGKSEAKKVIQSVTVDGYSPESPEDWQYLKNWFYFQKEFNIFIGRWNHLSNEFNLPIIENINDDSERKLYEINDFINESKKIINEYQPQIQKELPILFPQGLYDASLFRSIEQSQKAIHILEINITKTKHAKAYNTLHHMKETISSHSNPLIDKFHSFLSDSLANIDKTESDIKDEWDRLIIELQKYSSLQDDFKDVFNISEKIKKSGAQNWAFKLCSEPVREGKDHLIPLNWRECWNWKRLEGYLHRIDSQDKIKKISKERHDKVKQREDTLLRLVKKKT